MSITVKELIEELKTYEQDKEVFVLDADGEHTPIETTGFHQPRGTVVIYLEGDEESDEE
jgi:hypothetical protein